MSRWGSLLVFLVISVGGGFLIGSGNTPDDWYRHLQKPWFNPPDWIFAPAWTVIYVLVAIAGWRAFRVGNRRAMVAWGVQMALNFLWSPLFFSAHAILPALVVIVGLFVAIAAFLARVASSDRIAFWCFVPYAMWVAYATLLNFAIWRLNG
ncbi:TspO/MBR family protein [Aureimonas sp. ME7]|uniref:TspO/MBR family protein n=1 Tax=Aureimonas sp. ME7 TaxID=2744252 RepID=UPI0015F74F51|nr:TspO/MBR family protein [Aureimonas sp. ME7]